FLGTTSLGAQRWIYIGPFSFQPSEFSKLIIIITFADFLSNRSGRLNTFWEMFPCFIYLGFPVLLILIQPDLGTSLVFMSIMFGMLFMSGANKKILVGIIVFGLIMVFSIYEIHQLLHTGDIQLKNKIATVSKAINGDDYDLYSNKDFIQELKDNGYSLERIDLNKYLSQSNPEYQKKEARHSLFHKVALKEYQMTRLTIFMNPESDLLGAGYHVWQSRIAIGSGGITGKGLLKGTQSHYTFLPIRHTDFIFSVVGEEFGFVGGALVISLYFLLLYRGVKIIMVAKDVYGTLLATGIVSMFTFHIFLNIGMTSGIMPVTGIPLPLFSYGGSNIITNLASIGLLLNVYVRRKKLVF
ncbi:MAG: rod shape-determining protein RodA, partial [Peptococcaceae bacterium]|nr:rod shape-determining protein RodA [Peptococcaceae bacterium]